MFGLALFTVTSAGGLAPTILLLVLARLVQGVAGGILNPQVAGLIQQLFQGAERAGRSARSAPSSASRPPSGRCSAAG